MDFTKSVDHTVNETYIRGSNAPSCDGCSGCNTGSCSVDFTPPSDSEAPEIEFEFETLPPDDVVIQAGDTVVVLGCGSGNDAFAVRRLTGEDGHVIGVESSPALVTEAIENGAILGFHNVEFRLGEMFDLPIEKNSVDVLLCGDALSREKDTVKVVAELARIFKSGGRVYVSERVRAMHNNTTTLKTNPAAASLSDTEYFDLFKNAGFENIDVTSQSDTPISENVFQRIITAKKN